MARKVVYTGRVANVQKPKGSRPSETGSIGSGIKIKKDKEKVAG